MDEFNFTQDYLVCKPKKEKMYPILESDWDRLKRMINNIIPKRKVFRILASGSLGIFASSIFSLISFESAENLSDWVLPTTWSILFTSIILGIALLILDNQQKKVVTKSTKEVLDEMNIIEQKYNNPDDSLDDEYKDEETECICA
jgi:Na+/H+-dicarboxylate symporter